eukprot:2107981-Prymnesium_polylepis.1
MDSGASVRTCGARADTTHRPPSASGLDSRHACDGSRDTWHAAADCAQQRLRQLDLAAVGDAVEMV